MPQDKDIRTLTPSTRQGWHAIGLIILFLLLYHYSSRLNTLAVWSLVALLTAFFHQGIVVTIWRAELFGKHITRIFGPIGFYLHGTLFFILLAARILSAVGASLASPQTLPLHPNFWWAVTGVVIFFLTWAQYSVFKYFGVKRALGADHFFPEYQTKPFVRQGIFRYTSNGMYTFGTLGFILPGLILRSELGLAVGIFHYLAVWLHYWATELPDMAFIYGRTP